MLKMHENDEVVKQIFDYFRNVGIAALVLGATRWTTTAPSQLWLTPYALMLSTALLVLVGVSLFILNFRHGLFLLHKHLPPMSFKAVMIKIAHGLFIFSLFGALSSGIQR